MESHFRFARWNLAFGKLVWVSQHFPVFLSVIILTKNVELDSKLLEDSYEMIYDERVRVDNIVP